MYSPPAYSQHFVYLPIYGLEYFPHDLHPLVLGRSAHYAPILIAGALQATLPPDADATSPSRHVCRTCGLQMANPPQTHSHPYSSQPAQLPRDLPVSTESPAVYPRHGGYPTTLPLSTGPSPCSPHPAQLPTVDSAPTESPAVCPRHVGYPTALPLPTDPSRRSSGPAQLPVTVPASTVSPEVPHRHNERPAALSLSMQPPKP